MAETTGSATDLEDFFGKFLTWVGTQTGWTVDQTITTVDSGRQCAISKGNLFVQWRWDTTSPNTVAMYQSTAFSGASTRAGTHTGDSGNGYNAATSTSESVLTSERCIHLMGNSAFPSYYLYSNTAGDYLHAVVEINTDEFRHFGCGNLTKFGDWNTGSGGEYAYAHYGATTSQSTGGAQNILLDGAQNATSGSANQRQRGGTMLVSGLPGQGSEVWAHVWGNKSITETTDTAGNARLTMIGGTRGGALPRGFGWIPPSSSTKLAVTQPVATWYIDKTTTPNHAYLLGFMPDVRQVHLKYIAPKDTFTLGSETWRVFPSIRRTEGTAAGDTDYQGVAYLTNP